MTSRCRRAGFSASYPNARHCAQETLGYRHCTRSIYANFWSRSTPGTMHVRLQHISLILAFEPGSLAHLLHETRDLSNLGHPVRNTFFARMYVLQQYLDNVKLTPSPCRCKNFCLCRFLHGLSMFGALILIVY